LRQHELRPDLRVGQAGRNQIQHFALPGGETKGVRARGRARAARDRRISAPTHLCAHDVDGGRGTETGQDGDCVAHRLFFARVVERQRLFIGRAELGPHRGDVLPRVPQLSLAYRVDDQLVVVRALAETLEPYGELGSELGGNAGRRCQRHRTLARFGRVALEPGELDPAEVVLVA